MRTLMTPCGRKSNRSDWRQICRIQLPRSNELSPCLRACTKGVQCNDCLDQIKSNISLIINIWQTAIAQC